MSNINPDVICPHLQKQIDDLTLYVNQLHKLIKDEKAGRKLDTASIKSEISEKKKSKK